MTIGPRKSSVRGSVRAPKFLDKSSGFYARLDEPESAPLEDTFDEVGVMDARGPPEDDGQMLLRGTPGGRWRRTSSRRTQKQGASHEASPLDPAGPGVPEFPDRGNPLTHFACREDADDQVLIRDKKRMKREQEEVMKVVKRNTVKTCRKAVDRAFRRGWQMFLANIYSVTLTPDYSSRKKHQRNVVLAEFQ
ncbi:uncharacterized protein LOC144035098 [Vanacampus margaritifer]